MISNEVRQKYKVTIGIECHVQFKTNTKLFAAVSNDARSAEPNTLISHICLGMPGALPVLNKKAIEFASRAAFALGTAPQKVSKFDRKHYFYPDLPMGYQITQLYEPIVLNGKVQITVDGAPKNIGVARAHLEADAGKNTHPAAADYSLVDLNRAGTPLLEIVSEPELHSPAEARAYAEELYLLMKFADVSDCDLFQGNMRFDVNVSVSTTEKLGTRTETKNLNSFKSVERAAEYEINRQIELLEQGKAVTQETRGWDDAKQRTISQRGKEEAHDYRYMPDPDLPPVELSEDYIATIKSGMPLLPDDWRTKLGQLGLHDEQIRVLLIAEVTSDNVSYLPVVEAFSDQPKTAQHIANWLINVELPLRTEQKQSFDLKDESRLTMYQELYELVKQNKVSSTNAKLLISELLQHNNLPVSIEKYAEEQGLMQVSDTKQLESIVSKVLADNQQATTDVRAGELKAIGFLVGQVMKASQGKANPQSVQEIIKHQLGLAK